MDGHGTRCVLVVSLVLGRETDHQLDATNKQEDKEKKPHRQMRRRMRHASFPCVTTTTGTVFVADTGIPVWCNRTECGVDVYQLPENGVGTQLLETGVIMAITCCGCWESVFVFLWRLTFVPSVDTDTCVGWSPSSHSHTTCGSVLVPDTLFFVSSFTPVCTTELGQAALYAHEFRKRGIRLLGFSCNDVQSHQRWMADIEVATGGRVDFPLFADADRTHSRHLNLLDSTNINRNGLPMTVRNLYILKPNKTIALMISYPASTGRNMMEILRVCDSLLRTAHYQVATPVDWQPGDAVLVNYPLTNAQANERFGRDGYTIVPVPSEQPTSKRQRRRQQERRHREQQERLLFQQPPQSKPHGQPRDISTLPEPDTYSEEFNQHEEEQEPIRNGQDDDDDDEENQLGHDPQQQQQPEDDDDEHDCSSDDDDDDDDSSTNVEWVKNYLRVTADPGPIWDKVQTEKLSRRKYQGPGALLPPGEHAQTCISSSNTTRSTTASSRDGGKERHSSGGGWSCIIL